jgi:rod shape-determining protein MreD
VDAALMLTSLRVRATAALALTLVVHLTLLSRLRIDNIRPDALLLLAVMAGLVAGPERGAVMGFCAGLLADLFLQTPFGLSALAYCLVGFAIGSLQSGILRAAWWIPIATALGATVGGTILYALLGAMVGNGEFVSPRLLEIAAIVGFMNAALAPAAVRLVGWVFKAGVAERSYAT